MSSLSLPSLPSRVVLITGANRGIGLAILISLAHRSPRDTFLLGCRSLASGTTAIASVHQHTKQGLQLPSTTSIVPFQIDVTSDESVRAAVNFVEAEYGRLDVLVNNAGIAMLTTAEDFGDYREVYGKVYETNVTSVAVCMQSFLPLLRKSTSPSGGMVINVSSARASLSLSASGALPSTVAMAYSVSKTALNALTVLMAKAEEAKAAEEKRDAVRFQLVSPGHCKTAFNGYRGMRDPMEGANVVVELVNAEKGRYEGVGFWETKGDGREVVSVPW